MLLVPTRIGPGGGGVAVGFSVTAIAVGVCEPVFPG